MNEHPAAPDAGGLDALVRASSSTEFKVQLRRLIFDPLGVPVADPARSPIVSLASAINRSARQRVFAREVLPVLAAEWARSDGERVLLDVIHLVGLTRAVDSRSAIMELISRRIPSDFVAARRDAIGVIVGLGLNPRAARAMHAFLDDPETASTAYLALCRFDEANVGRLFLRLFEALGRRAEFASDTLGAVLLMPRETSSIVRRVVLALRCVNLECLREFLDALFGAGISVQLRVDLPDDPGTRRRRSRPVVLFVCDSSGNTLGTKSLVRMRPQKLLLLQQYVDSVTLSASAVEVSAS